MNQTVEKFKICVWFSIDLLLVVCFSEVLRYLMLASIEYITLANLTSIPLLASLLVLLMVLFGIIPLFLLAMWLSNSHLIEKLLSATFGLTEKSIDKRQQNENKP